MAQRMYPQSEPGSRFNMINMSGHSGPAGLSPESPDALNMNLSSFASSLAALPNHGNGPFHDFPSLGGNGHAHQVPTQDPSILHLIRSDDAPWNPLKANAPPRMSGTKSRQTSSMSVNYDIACFSGYRNTAVPSEYEDSGYYGSMSGGMTAHSIVESSVYGDPDRGTETQSFVQAYEGLQLYPQQSQSSDSAAAAGGHRQKESSWSQPRPTTNHTEPSSNYFCEGCNSFVKTKAELNKHKLRHEKPFLCGFPGCTRKQGFGTVNDLQRHRQSVHSADGIKYRCRLGPCSAKTKNWPRADNFKQHLRRIHGLNLGPDADLSSWEYRPSRAEDLACLGSSEAQVDMPAHPDHLSPSSWMGLDQSQDSSDLPSGEMGYNQMSHVVELPQSQRPEDEQTEHSVVGSGEVEHHNQHSLEDSRLELDMSPTLSEFRDQQDHMQNVQPTALGQLYQEDSHADKPDTISPADISSSPVDLEANFFHVVSRMGRDNQPEPVGNKNVEGSLGDEPCILEESDQMNPGQRGQDSAQGKPTHNAPGTAISIEDDSEDEDAADALDDSKDFFPSQDGTSDRHIKSSNSPKNAGGTLLTAELPSVRDLLAGNTNIDETEASAIVKSLLERGLLDKIISGLGYQIAKEEEEKPKEDQPGAAASIEKEGNEVPCPECTKKFKRPCELKKHMKRHQKPYACTHTECDKRFGSKNDWKRHENSQHIQLEFWRCSEKIKDRLISCGKICHRRETFKHHLERDHGITETKTLEKRCTDCRNGRNFESRFWCGFCQRTIEFEKNGGLAWSERFDHIDNHFTGKNGPVMDIKDWKSIELEEIFENILPDNNRLFDPPSSSESTDHSDGQGESRKRRAEDDDDGTSSKRMRGYKIDPRKESVFWYCCGCENYWSHATTTRCMDCSHDCCGQCTLELQQKPVDDI